MTSLIISAFQILLLLTMLSAGCSPALQSAADAQPPIRKPVLLPLPTTCPYGHAGLRDTPVLYGLLMMTPELRRQIDDHEVVTGGCVVMPGVSPPNLLICTRCQYRYNPIAAEWERFSEDAKSFERPLAAILTGFPMPAPRSPYHVGYRQSMKDGQVVVESASRWTGERIETVTDAIDRYLMGQGVTARLSRLDMGDRVYTDRVGVVGDRTLRITTLAMKQPPDVNVSIELISERRP